MTRMMPVGSALEASEAARAEAEERLACVEALESAVRALPYLRRWTGGSREDLGDPIRPY